ncbi:MAG TPA: DUF1800 domain-containing protein [Actinophytocola sp.]|jgi:uncharacterized protein (DUF1800 family)|uniref:DUF1800 domain-containing protein n=1 Tax=Actinophytocola sp. TaxID=1872138 RepID=UPI002F943A91
MVEVNERSAVRRLYDRFGFGARPGDLDQPFAEALDRLLTAPPGGNAPAPPDLPPPPRPEKNKKDKSAEQTEQDRAAKKKANKARAAQQKQLAAWWLDRMVAVDVATTERLTWFWHGHFATSAQKVKIAKLMLDQNEKFRKLGLGSFTDLAHAMIDDPAMIVWLDGNDNKAGAANENLAREFMELFTLGVGHYTEDDVREAARALTGWTIDRKTGVAKFVAKRHDDKPATIFGKQDDYDASSFVDLALSREESAPFVVGRLWYRLVSPTPPDEQARGRLLDAYGARRDIKATLRAIASEPAFRDEKTALVKQPVEWLVGLLRALGVRPSALDEKLQAKLYKGLMGLGQVPFRPPSVGGWPSGASWLTTAAGLTRLKVAQAVVEQANLDSLAQNKDKVEAVRALLAVDAWSDRTRAALGKVAADPAKVTALAACAPEYVVSA